jgi:LPS export ABC transporter protein LptC
MVSFQLRQNLLITVFIIVIIGFVWLLMLLLSYSFSSLGNQQQALLVQSKTTFSEVAYIEKIDNFILQEFNAKAQLSHFVKAKSYFSFKNSPALLIEPEVTLYDEKGLKDYVLNSKRAHYTDSGEIKFKGEVSIQSSNGLKHKINTEELLVGIKTHDLISKKPVTYLGENVKIISQGIHMHAKDDIIKSTGRTKINQDNGQQILTKNLYINQSKKNKTYANGADMDRQKQVIKLLGKVKIVQDSGSKINTKNLTIDQSNGLEVYRTKEKIHYQSNIADIHALGMNYDLIKQKIKLTGGVVGRYE